MFPMTVDSATGVAWLQSLSRFGEKPGLERTLRVLEYFNHPEKTLKFFHVAGTNGKGSVCAFLTPLLSLHGRVGTFTSPAFDGFRGRFLVCNETIIDKTFNDLAIQVRDGANSVVADDMLTEFEALTIMAILYFNGREVDYVVWETGLGGRYDSTNVVMPIVTAITNVGLDHQEILGVTHAAIAADKSGIIKPGVPVITAAQDSAYIMVEREANRQSAKVYAYGQTFQVAPEGYDGRVQRMTYRGLLGDIYHLPIVLYGEHQYQNAAVAIAMYEAAILTGTFSNAGTKAIHVALEQVKWPGRFEVLRLNNQTVVLDGAHNAEGAQAFSKSLRAFGTDYGLSDTLWTMVVGILQDKNSSAMLSHLLPLAKRVIATEPQNSRAKKTEELAKDMKRCGVVPIDTADSVAEAVMLALADKNPVAIWGSLYTVDEARNAIKHTTCETAW